MERIDRKTMAGLMAAYGTHDTPRVYTHRNRLVGELFWRSHERMLALSRVVEAAGGCSTSAAATACCSES